MCGICGQYCIKGNPDKELIFKMSEILKHRGPDADGTYFNDEVGLAHRRLSIIDLSDNANQPMYNKSGTIALVFNGEIYNYKKLREELVELGHKFRTSSDTEVIIHAYEQWDKNCLMHLDGMWAFALWDDIKKLLFCARDRFGIKPFYYAIDNDTLIFASEIKALLANPNLGKNPNEVVLEYFLSSGIMDDSHLTMFEGIYQIPPSQGFIVNKFGLSRFQYYNLKVSPMISISNKCDNTIGLDVLIKMYQSIYSHLQSDVPVGTCLSGGIDSSTIVKLISTISNADTKQSTFSACFDDKRFDETDYIELITEDIGEEQKIDAYYTKPTVCELIQDLDNLIYIQDEPFGSLSIYAQYCVMRLAQGKVKVLLDGQGADELFAGYLSYQQNYIKELFRRKQVIRGSMEILGSLKHHRKFYYYMINQLIARNIRKDLFTNYMKSHRYEGKFDKLLYNELFKTNLQSLLHFEDRNSMAFSIESRVPYLDTSLVNLVVSLPYDQKIRNGITKIALRNAVKERIPEHIRMRTDKMGFVTPEEVWMKSELWEFVMGIFNSEGFKKRKYWKPEKVKKNYQKFIDGKSEYSPELWRIVCTELWLRKFFDNRDILFSDR